MRVRLSRLDTVTPASMPAICGRLASGRERPGRLLAQDVERLLQRGGVGQRHARAHGLRRAGDQRLDVVEVVGDQQAGERQVGERRVAGPGAQHAGDAAVFEPGAVGRHDVIDAAQDDRDVGRLLVAAERAQVAEVTQVAVDPLHGLQRLAHLLLELRALPLRDDFAAALDDEAVAEVVGQHHAEALEQRVFEEVREADQPVAHGQRGRARCRTG